MPSPTVGNELQPHAPATVFTPSSPAGLNREIDWRETCWFLEREEDELAGYLFAEDYEVREGSD